MPASPSLWIAGLRRLKKNDEFTQPEQVRDQLEEYKRRNDNVAAFVAERVRQGPLLKANKQRFYREYREWCENQGLNPISQTKLKDALQRSVSELDEGRESNNGPRCWIGIELI